MDLIYMDTNHNDVGVLKDYTFDLAFGSDENDFELTVDPDHHCCEPNCFVYIEGTEYGGIIDRVHINTKDDRLSYSGRTWHGILASKIIEPDKGQAYLMYVGEANGIISDILDRIGLSELFEVPHFTSGLYVNDYAFDRYTDAYSGLTKMVEGVSGKLHFSFKNGKVILSATPLVDYSQDEQFSDDQIEMDIEKAYNTVNHLICLGSGELAARQVIHLYKDANGNITEKQTFTGLQEVTATYDYPNAKDADELKSGGIDRFKEFTNGNKVKLNFEAEQDTYDIGDKVGAKETKTGTVATERINKKIVTINQGMVNIQYKVGE